LAVRRELGLLLRNWRRRWLEGAFAHADNSIDRVLCLDNYTYLPGCLLVKMDIASMRCGLETRSPLLDHEVIEFCARLPVQYKVKDRVGKYLLKKVAERCSRADFFHRRKGRVHLPVGRMVYVRPCAGLYVLCTTPLDVELMEPLSARLIERAPREFARIRSRRQRACIPAADADVWVWRLQKCCDRITHNPVGRS